MTDKTTAEREALDRYLKDCDTHAIVPDVGGAFHAAFMAGRASLPLPGAQEAVAWAMFADNGNIRLWSKKPIPHPDAIPLYAAPQPAPPSSICTDCSHADSWNIPDEPCCRTCTSGSNWEPLNSGSVNPNKALTAQAISAEPAGAWIERWHGSGGKEGHEGWSIVDTNNRSLVAYLGREVDPDAVTAIVMAHNAIRASHGQAPAQPVDFTTLGAAMRAIQQAIGLIGDPADERMQAVRRVLRGAVVVAEDSGEIPAQQVTAAPTVEQVEDEVSMGHGAWDLIDPKELINAVLRLATPQAADTPAQQPAPAREGGDYPPLPDPFTQLVRKTSWHAECWEAAPAGAQLYGRLWADERKDTYTAPQMRAYVDADRAARAQTPADSVLEDAALLDWLGRAGPTSICVVMDRNHDGEVEVSTDDVTGYGNTLRAAIDAARAQQKAGE